MATETKERVYFRNVPRWLIGVVILLSKALTVLAGATALVGEGWASVGILCAKEVVLKFIDLSTKRPADQVEK